MEFRNKFLDQYRHFKSQFGSCLLGVVEIGSYARGEAVSYSDHDFRLIIRSINPLIIQKEELWSKTPVDDVTYIEWEQLNQIDAITFGLTNLAFIEKALLNGLFPVIDHTCLFQGKILIDEPGEIERFCSLHHGIFFPNIITDYMRQTEWRVTNRLPREVTTLTEEYNEKKFSIPVIHTCFRIARDLANISTYHEHKDYLRDNRGLQDFYHGYPEYERTFLKLNLYKTDETIRRVVFKETVAKKPERITEIINIAKETTTLWGNFSDQYRNEFQRKE